MRATAHRRQVKTRGGALFFDFVEFFSPPVADKKDNVVKSWVTTFCREAIGKNKQGIGRVGREYGLYGHYGLYGRGPNSWNRAESW